METRRRKQREARSICDARRVGDAHRMIGELMLAFGVTPHLDGFDPISQGIRIRAERKGQGALPPKKALSHETAIRTAIGIGFLRADGIHAQIFPFTDRPSSSEFICTLAALVRDRIGEN
jgi:hypothetical protein